MNIKIIYKGKIEKLKDGGVYIIFNLKNGKQYIGSTNNFRKRFGDHCNFLKKNKHPNQYLQNAFNFNIKNYGEHYFEFRIREICKNNLEREQDILNKEIFCLDNYANLYYNISKGAVSPMLNRVHTTKAKNKISLSLIGNTRTLGHKLSEEHKEKISKYLRGEKNPSFNKRGKDSPIFGNVRSEEIRLKISKALIGRVLPEEVKLKISQANFGRKMGKESPRYISPILARNIDTGEEVLAYSMRELSEKIHISPHSVERRLCTGIKDYTNKPIKSWIIVRIINE